jgi:prephenate dehydratase
MKRIFQGELAPTGASLCRARPDYEPLPCPTFEAATAAVRLSPQTRHDRRRKLHVWTCGRRSRCSLKVGHIVDEAFVRVHINLLGKPGSKPDPVRRRSCCDPSQCGKFLRNHGMRLLPVPTARVLRM